MSKAELTIKMMNWRYFLKKEKWQFGNGFKTNHKKNSGIFKAAGENTDFTKAKNRLVNKNLFPI